MSEFSMVCRSRSATSDEPTELGVLGPITRSTTAALRSHLRLLIESPVCGLLRIDLACCTGIDMDGMLALAVAQQAARQRSGDLRVVNPPPLIERQLRQHNFHELLEPSSDPAPQRG